MRVCPAWNLLATRWATAVRLFVGGGLLLVGACQPRRNAPTSSGTSLSKNLEASLTDSLRTYWHLTEFLQRNDSPDYVLRGIETRFGKVGVIAITDSSLLLFQDIGHRFQLTNRIAFDSYATGFKETDLNGDGHDDFIVYGYPNMHGQAPPYLFINDGKGLLHYYQTPHRTMYAIEYDPVRKLVQTEYVGGACSVHGKALYQWQGDSLRLVAGAELHLDHPDTVTVRAYRVRNGREYDVKTYAGGEVYDTLLFKSTE